ncbi:MAG: DUF1311 domain-containing protein [Acidobacteria bacterium]|jgi:uncharacterized protein YecT (DUF1311 family)|nr:DUF1311 domain-containing protein [Acidobacteriota bacterium]
MNKLKVGIMALMIFPAAVLAADDAVIAEIRRSYAETAAAIALARKGEGGGLYCNEVLSNSHGGSWRAVGSYSRKAGLWFSEQPEFAAAAGREAKSTLVKVEVRETAAAVTRYREFFFMNGGLAFYFRAAGPGDGASGEERIYFRDGKPLLRLLGKEASPEAQDAVAILREAAYWQRLFLLSFDDALPAPAAAHSVDSWLAACQEKDPSAQGMNQCLGQAYEKWDAELNRAYRELGGRLDEGLRPALREAQRAWVAFRDGELAWLAKFYGGLDGSMYRNMLAADRVELVRRRVLELISFLDVLEQE